MNMHAAILILGLALSDGVGTTKQTDIKKPKCTRMAKLDVYFTFERSSWVNESAFNQGRDVAKKIFNKLDVGDGLGQVRCLLSYHSNRLLERLRIDREYVQDQLWIIGKHPSLFDDFVKYDSNLAKEATDLNVAAESAYYFAAYARKDAYAAVVMFANGVNIGHAPTKFGSGRILFVQEGRRSNYSENNMRRITDYYPGSIAYADQGDKAVDVIVKRLHAIHC